MDCTAVTTKTQTPRSKIPQDEELISESQFATVDANLGTAAFLTSDSTLRAQSIGSTREQADRGVMGVSGSAQSSSKSRQSSEDAELKLESEEGLRMGDEEEPCEYAEDMEAAPVEEHRAGVEKASVCVCGGAKVKRLPERYHSRAKVLARE